MSRSKISLTERAVENAIAAGGDQWLWDIKVPGLGVRIYPDKPGADQPAQRIASYFIRYKMGRGRKAPRRRMTIGRVGQITLESARTIARQHFLKIGMGDDPLQEQKQRAAAVREAATATRTAKTHTVEALARRFMHEEIAPQNRQAPEYQRIIDRYVLPEWGSRQIDAIRRADVLALLSKVRGGTIAGSAKRGRGGKRQPGHDGRAMAHNVLAVIRRMFGWHAMHTEGFVSPVVKGMSPIARPHEMARERVLTDDELRRVWKAAELEPPPYGALIRFLFLTAVRRDEAGGMQWAELDESGKVWTIPAERMKNKRPHVVPLSDAARALLASLPRLQDAAGNDSSFVFTTTGAKPFNGFSKAKSKIDTASGTSGWRLHDIRRTARGLMSRGGVPSDIAERVLAHSMVGVRGTYDRHQYLNEKRHALAVLADQIERVLKPTPQNVVPLHIAKA